MNTVRGALPHSVRGLDQAGPADTQRGARPHSSPWLATNDLRPSGALQHAAWAAPRRAPVPRQARWLWPAQPPSSVACSPLISATAYDTVAELHPARCRLYVGAGRARSTAYLADVGWRWSHSHDHRSICSTLPRRTRIHRRIVVCHAVAAPQCRTRQPPYSRSDRM